jgi:sortase A
VTRSRSGRRALLAVVIVLAAGGVWQVGSALFIPAKAVVAQILLHRAWVRTLAGEDRVKPWPWADTWPVARLTLPGTDTDLIVLAGVSGQALAFGPGHVAGTAAPGRPGLSMIGGHRDTHLKVLATLEPGNRVEIQRPDGATRVYRVDATTIADARLPWAAPENTDGLVLVTCYPFDALVPGGPLRYLVHATPLYTADVSADVSNAAKPTGIPGRTTPY